MSAVRPSLCYGARWAPAKRQNLRSVRQDDPAAIRSLANGQHVSPAGSGHAAEEPDPARGGHEAPAGPVPVLGERPLELAPYRPDLASADPGPPSSPVPPSPVLVRPG